MNGHDTSTSADCLASSARRAGGVALILVLVYALAAPLIFSAQGSAGLVAAAVAAAVCGMSVISAQFTAAILMGAGQPVGAALLGMLFRMAPALVFCLAVGRRPGPLTDAGVVFYVIGFYMVTLAVDTWMLVGRLPLGSSSRGM